MDKNLAFFKAIKAGDTGKIKSLLKYKPELAHAVDEQGISAIMTAVYYGWQPINQELVERNQELSIWEAAATGQVENVKQTLEMDESLLSAYSTDGFTALSLAAFFGQKSVVEYLLSKGAKVNQAASNATHVQPIHSAAAHHNPVVAMQMLQVLLENGAQVDARQIGGWTALHEAASRGDVEMVKLLKRYGADISIKSDDGKTARELAIEKGHENILQLL